MMNLRRLGTFLLALLGSSAALADIVLKPAGGNVWELVVFGNATAVAEVLKGVTLMMAPSDQGGHGFRSLMVFMALLGFLVSMIQAVSDPGKNLLKAVTYILVAWAVSYFTVTLKANVAVIDQLSGQTIIVDKVPALASVPASVVSQIGVFLTKEFEKNLTIPGSMKISESGQAMLFSRVMEAANEVRITDPEILKSMQAYVSNCTVPAVARGRMSLSGLLSATNYVDELGKANFNAVLTSFYPSLKNFDDKSGQGQKFNTSCLSTAVDADAKPINMAEAKGNQGILLTCKEAHSCLRSDLDNFARAALSANGEQMGTSGANVTMEQALSDALSLQSRGQAYSGNFSSPNGYLMQRAAISSLSGSFRAAAVKSGNNEYLQAAAGAQAEAQQRSSWIAAAHSFRNIMGYIYIILQTFVFAIVPVVVIAMFIPGAGMGMAKNYFQVLIWLVLWMPLLSVVSYLSTLFAVSDLQGPFNVAGGLTAANSGAISEKAAALADAADFMAASVPMFTWGLVKGAMAFTEFISHGLGMNYAQQAGATATTGNLSMNNMGLDSFKANTFGNVMSSHTGVSALRNDNSAGAGFNFADMGGSGAGIAGGNISSSKQMQEQFQQNLSAAKQTAESKAMDASTKIGNSLSEVIKHGESWSKSDSASYTAALNLSEAYKRGAGTDELAKLSEAYLATRNNAVTSGSNASAGVSGSAGVNVAGTGAAANASSGVSLSDQTTTTNQTSGGHDHALGGSLNQQASIDNALSDVYNQGLSFGHSQSNGIDKSWSTSRDNTLAQSHNLSASRSAAEQISQAQSATESFSFNQNVNRNDMEAVSSQISSMQSRLAPALQQAGISTGGVGGQLAGNGPQGLSLGSGAAAPGVGAYGGNNIAGTMAAGRAGVRADAAGVTKAAGARVADGKAQVQSRGSKVADHNAVAKALTSKF